MSSRCKHGTHPELRCLECEIGQLEAELQTASMMLLDLAVDTPEELEDARISIDGWDTKAVAKIRQKISDLTTERITNE